MTQWSTRAEAFQLMKRGSLPDMNSTLIYGVQVSDMTTEELRIALGWSLSQHARLMGPNRVGRQQ